MLEADPTTTLPFDALDAAPGEIARRFREAMEMGRPRWVWPELAVADWRASLRAIEDVLRARLLRPEEPSRLAAPAGPAALGIAAFTSGTGPLLGWWAENGLLHTDPRSEALLRLHLEHGRVRMERLRGVLASAASLLAVGGVRATLVKGMHTADLLFPDPGTRPMSDIDLVVRVEDFAAAERALGSGGFTPVAVTREQTPPHADWIPPGSPRSFPSLQLAHAHAPMAVNIRGGFAYPVFGSSPVDLGTPAPGSLAEGPHPGVQVLQGAWLLAYLALHASHHRTNLTLVRIAEVAMAARAGVDWDDFMRLLRSRGATHFVYPAIALAERLAPGSVPAQVLRQLERRALPRHRRMFADASPAAVQPPGESTLADYAYWARGPLGWLGVVRAVALPGAPLRRWPALWLRRARLAWARVVRLRAGANQG